MTRHAFDLKVRFSDVDVFGHVNNVKYFEYFQEARLSFLSALRGVDGLGGSVVVVAQMTVEYKRPILFRLEPYAVETWVSRVGTSSYTISAEIKDADAVLSRADAVLVGFDAKTQRAAPLSEETRARLLEALE